MSKKEAAGKHGVQLGVHVETALVLKQGRVSDRWWLRALIPTLVGIFVVARHDFWPAITTHEGHWRETITHLGVAFLVTGIVVFGYEWGSDHKKMSALTATLLNLLNENVSDVLHASDRLAVKNALKNLSGPDGEMFAPHFLSLADSIARLGRGEWTSKSYLQFLEHYLGELTGKAAGLADMSEKLQNNASISGSEYRLLMPDAPKLVDVLVEATMKELSERGGMYYAVSDTSTWDKLTAFTKAHRESLGRIQTKRIFVLGRDSDRLLPSRRVNDIINSHYRESRVLKNRYEIKITSQTEYRRLRIPELTDAVHFGIWAPAEKTPIAVLAIDDNLSNFRLAAVPPEMMIAFMTLWDRLDDLTDEPLGPVSKVRVGDAVIQDYMLAYRVNRMGHGTHYRGVSKMTMWSEGGLKRFFEASCDAVNDKEIWVKRIFVFDEREERENQRILDIIKDHADAAAATTHYEWRVCLRDRVPAELTPLGMAMFEGDDDGKGQLMSEVAVGPSGPDSPARVESQPRAYETKVRIFDEFWKTLEPEESIRTVFGKQAKKVLEIIAAATT